MYVLLVCLRAGVLGGVLLSSKACFGVRASAAVLVVAIVLTAEPDGPNGERLGPSAVVLDRVSCVALVRAGV